MPELLMIAGGVLLGVLIGTLLYFMFPRESVLFADEREERLTRELAEQLRCPLDAALEAVRKELSLGPNQPDDTILKRAAYHYRQNLTDGGPCRTYRDRAPG
jgi:hypothetical protein